MITITHYRQLTEDIINQAIQETCDLIKNRISEAIQYIGETKLPEIQTDRLEKTLRKIFTAVSTPDYDRANTYELIHDVIEIRRLIFAGFGAGYYYQVPEEWNLTPLGFACSVIMGEKLLTVKDVADMFGKSTQWVRINPEIKGQQTAAGKIFKYGEILEILRRNPDYRSK